MRTLTAVLALCFVLTALPAGAAPIPDGKVLAKDPQLMQTWWISQATNERVSDRDVFAVERDGKKITEAIVVNVMADHSVVMVRNSVDLQKGDVVRFVRHSAEPRETVATTPSKDYKVVGAHSLVFTSSVNTNLTGFPSFHVPGSAVVVNSLGLGVQSFSLSSGLKFDGDLRFGSTTSFGSGFSLPAFNSTSGFDSIRSSWSVGGSL